MPVSDDSLLEANAAVIAGTLIFLTINSALAFGSSKISISPNYLAILVIFPFALSGIALLKAKGYHSKGYHATNEILDKASKQAKRLTIIGFILLVVVFSIIGLNSIISQPPVSMADKCAQDPTRFNVTHAYDCTKFMSGSIAERCVQDPGTYNLTNIASCSRFISPT